MSDVESLINEMKETKADNPELSIEEVLSVFNIQAMRELAGQIRRVANNG